MRKLFGYLLLICVLFSNVAIIHCSAQEPIDSFNHVVQFLPTQTEQTLNFSMQKNEVYMLYFKPETTNVLYRIQIMITSPSGQIFKILNFEDDCRWNITEHRTWFTPYETGFHTIQIKVTPSRAFNIRIRIEPYSSIREYYIDSIIPDLSKSNVTINMFYNSTVNFNTLEKIHNLTVEMEADQEYVIDFFRGNPITAEEIQEKTYIYPRITLWLRIGNIRYLLYENLLLHDQSYHTNKSFTVPFGAHNTSANVFDLEMEPSAISLNMIFVCYAVQTTTKKNTTTETPTNSTSNYQFNSSLIDNWEMTALSFMDQNKDALILSTGAAIVVLSAINYYRTKKKPKPVDSADNRE